MSTCLAADAAWAWAFFATASRSTLLSFLAALADAFWTALSMPLVSMDASLDPALAKDAWIAFASTSTAKFLPSCFMPASRFVVSVFASTDAEIFFPAAAKPG